MLIVANVMLFRPFVQWLRKDQFAVTIGNEQERREFKPL